MNRDSHTAGSNDLEQRFDAAMLETYERASRELAYRATRYLQLLRRRGGPDTARYLLASRVTSDGYARLRDAGRLDLTVEALVLQPEFEPLDAHLAALAIEHGAEVISTDTDFARFTEIRWSNPLAGS